MAEDERALYVRVGGMPAFRRLAEAFYEGVAGDPVLRPLYPETLEEPAENLGLFMAQYFGGPSIYMQKRGHPRLRMRHMPFVIGKRERDAWVGHMLAALAEAGIAEPERSEMQKYFEDAATFLINQEEGDGLPMRGRNAE